MDCIYTVLCIVGLTSAGIEFPIRNIPRENLRRHPCQIVFGVFAGSRGRSPPNCPYFHCPVYFPVQVCLDGVTETLPIAFERVESEFC